MIHACGVFRIRAAKPGSDSRTPDLSHFTVAVNSLDVSLQGTFFFARLERETYRRESSKQNMKKRYGHKKFVLPAWREHPALDLSRDCSGGRLRIVASQRELAGSTRNHCLEETRCFAISAMLSFTN